MIKNNFSNIFKKKTDRLEQISNILDEFKKSKDLEQIAIETTKSFKDQWQEGNTANDNRDIIPFVGLTEKTIRQRQVKKEEGILNDSLTTPETSNMIETGALYNDTNFKLTDKGFTIESNPIHNKKLIGNANRGRVVFKLSNKIINSIREKSIEVIQAISNSLNTEK